MTDDPQRRRFLKVVMLGAAAAPLALRYQRTASADQAGDGPVLGESSATARALAYVADAAQVDRAAFPAYAPGQTCRNCSQYLGLPADNKAGCQLVLGEYVLAGGWCKAWEAKPES